MSMAIGLPVCRDHIHAVLGVESFFVANSISSGLQARIDIPCFGLLIFANDSEVGRLAGWDAGM